MAHGHRRHGRHGNPADLAGMITRQLDPKRAVWQKPVRVVDALGLRRGQVVAEIGSGPGNFTLRLAQAVGPSGRVYAVDAEPALLEMLRERLRRAVARSLVPRGRVVNIDRDTRETPVGPPLARRIPSKAFARRSARRTRADGRAEPPAASIFSRARTPSSLARVVVIEFSLECSRARV